MLRRVYLSELLRLWGELRAWHLSGGGVASNVLFANDCSVQNYHDILAGIVLRTGPKALGSISHYVSCSMRTIGRVDGGMGVLI